jgi:hypothetical protein
MQGADIPNAGNGDPQLWLLMEPRAESLGDEEIEQGREGAPLSHPCMPGTGARLDSIGVNRSYGVAKHDASPVDHSLTGSHGEHDSEKEGTSNGVKGFGNVDKHSGPCDAMDSHDMRQQAGEVDIVCNQTARQVG